MATLANRANRSNSGSSAGLASDHSGDDLHLEDDDLDVAEVDLDGMQLPIACSYRRKIPFSPFSSRRVA
jgi:hypothetical protein